MTSLKRSYLNISLLTIVAICSFGQQIDQWDSPAWFGIIGVAASTMANGLSKSPRDAAITDAETGEVVSTTTAKSIDTKTDIKMEGTDEANS